MSSKQLVINLTPLDDEALKPAELIKSQADQNLTLYARRAITILWHNAHKNGIERDKTYSIPMSDLRTDTHNGNDVVRQAIKSLQTTLLTIRHPETDVEENVQLLGPTKEVGYSKKNGVLTYRFPAELFELIKDSAIWGRIEILVLMHLASKYSISLYEHTSQWVHLKYQNSKEFSLEDFRRLIGIEDGKYPAFGGLNKHIIKKSVDEINALSDFSISVMPMKTGKRVTHVKIFWHKKTEDERRDAYAELKRHKTGRRARIEGKVEHVKPVSQVSERNRKMRLEGSRIKDSSPISSQFDDTEILDEQE